MIPSWLCSYPCFIMLLHGCIAPKMYRPIDSPEVISERRTRVKAIAEDDPCTKKMWLYMEPEERQAAAKVCEDARVAFNGLLPDEVKQCPKAFGADCRPLPLCDNLLYGCSFICVEGFLVPTINPITGSNEQKLESEQKVRHLQQIVKELFPEKPVSKKRMKREDDEGSSSGSKRKSRRKTTDLVLHL